MKTRAAFSTQHDRGSTMALIQEIWAEMLGRGAVGPDGDFFELGGHSIKAVAAVSRLSERLGFDLPMLALFEAPTPIEMAALIAELRAARERRPADGISPFFPDWVVPLQREGAGRPVFVFPIAHNEPRALVKDAQVAALVGRGHPFWGLRQEHRDLERAKAQGVPALAAEYVTHMRRLQGRGPYRLYANCGGGYLAWEVAKQLLASGEDIVDMLFYQVPLRPDYARLMPGHTPAHISRPWHLSLYFRPHPLPVDLTVLMTESWRARGWWAAWQQVTLGVFDTVVIPDDAPEAHGGAPSREEKIAHHVRTWIEEGEVRLGAI